MYFYTKLIRCGKFVLNVYLKDYKEFSKKLNFLCIFALETVNFELVWFSESSLGEPLANVLSLVSLQLQHFTVFWVLDHSPVASKLLQAKKYS